MAFDPESLSSKAVDTNGDGLFDELDLTRHGDGRNRRPVLHQLGAVRESWGQVAAEYMTFQLSAGPNRVTLVYKGSDIAKAGQDGPYVVPTLDGYLTADRWRPVTGVRRLHDSGVQASQFGP